VLEAARLKEFRKEEIMSQRGEKKRKVPQGILTFDLMVLLE